MSIGISFFKKFKNTHVCKSCNVLEAELGDSGCRMPYMAANPMVPLDRRGRWDSEGLSTCPVWPVNAAVRAQPCSDWQRALLPFVFRSRHALLL